MTRPEDSQEISESDDTTRAPWRTRIPEVIVVAAVTFVIDVLVLTYVVPWADEEFVNLKMSMGYVITYLTVFINFVIALALVAHLFHQDSYPSDRWK